MKLKCYLFSILFSLTFVANSQNISVKSFQPLQNDMDARVNYPKTDQNGEKCAIIKVVTTEQGFVWEGDALGIADTKFKTSEYWLYVPHGAKRITIKHPKLGMLRDYIYPVPIKEATVYEMVLTTAKLTTIVEEYEIHTQWVVITSEPEGADVYINDQHKGQTPWQMEMEEGEYTYRIDKLLYHSQAGKFNLIASEGKKTMHYQLTPDYGYVKISTTPESGATISVNGNQLSQKSPVTTEKLKTGIYTVKAEKNMYYPASKEVSVGSGNTVDVNLELKPAFGKLTIKTLPEINADVKINGELKGKTPLIIDRYKSGTYNLEVYKSMYHSDNREIVITDGQVTTVNVELKPAFGGFNVTTTPEKGAQVLVDGQPTNKKTPCTLERLSNGEHTITVRKEWYEPISKRITIVEGQDGEITIEMRPTFGHVKIISDAQSSIYIDEQYKAIGSWEGRLIAGWHTFEARKEKHHSASEKQEIFVGDNREIQLTPQPMYGTLKIQTTPFDATIKLNGKEYGTTPNTINDLLVGDYTVTLEKENFGTITKTITITENQTTNINETLPAGMEVSFTSDPAGAELYVDGVKMGTTPLKLTLSFGNHKIRVEKDDAIKNEIIDIKQKSKSSYMYDVNTRTDRFIDKRDGKTYNTIKIGNQIWMSENLAFKTESGCWLYNNDSQKLEQYGFLYNWEMANNSCPDGWHLPSDSEWDTLIIYLGGKNIAGGKMKESGNLHWDNPNLDATNESGFNALPGGRVDFNDKFLFLRSYTYFWSSSEYSSSHASYQGLRYSNSDIYRRKSSKNTGFSVRCIKD